MKWELLQSNFSANDSSRLNRGTVERYLEFSAITGHARSQGAGFAGKIM